MEVLRFWGIVTGAALIAFALWVAALGPETAPASAAPQATLAQAQSQPLSFLVRFQGSGPIARAQANAAHGGLAQGQRVIERQLSRQHDFAGLCFDRFTAGAAEVVLRTCDAVAAADRANAEARWLSRLRAMRAVAYADVNAVAAPGRAG